MLGAAALVEDPAAVGSRPRAGLPSGGGKRRFGRACAQHGRRPWSGSRRGSPRALLSTWTSPVGAALRVGAGARGHGEQQGEQRNVGSPATACSKARPDGPGQTAKRARIRSEDVAVRKQCEEHANGSRRSRTRARSDASSAMPGAALGVVARSRPRDATRADRARRRATVWMSALDVLSVSALLGLLVLARRISPRRCCAAAPGGYSPAALVLAVLARRPGVGHRALDRRPLLRRVDTAGRCDAHPAVPRAPSRPGGNHAARLLRAVRQQRARGARAGARAGARGRPAARRGAVLGYAFVLFFALAVFATNQFHKWAHATQNARPVRWLQASGLILVAGGARTASSRRLLARLLRDHGLAESAARLAATPAALRGGAARVAAARRAVVRLVVSGFAGSPCCRTGGAPGTSARSTARGLVCGPGRGRRLGAARGRPDRRGHRASHERSRRREKACARLLAAPGACSLAGGRAAAQRALVALFGGAARGSRDARRTPRRGGRRRHQRRVRRGVSPRARARGARARRRARGSRRRARTRAQMLIGPDGAHPAGAAADRAARRTALRADRAGLTPAELAGLRASLAPRADGDGSTIPAGRLRRHRSRARCPTTRAASRPAAPRRSCRAARTRCRDDPRAGDVHRRAGDAGRAGAAGADRHAAARLRARRERACRGDARRLSHARRARRAARGPRAARRRSTA